MTVTTMRDGVVSLVLPAAGRILALCVVILASYAASRLCRPSPHPVRILDVRWSLRGAGLFYGLMCLYDAINSLIVFGLLSHGFGFYPLLDISRALELIPPLVILYVVLRKEEFRRVFGVRLNPRNLLWSCASILIIVGISVVTSYLGSMSGTIGNEIRPLVKPSGAIRALFEIFRTCVITPASEEVLFRGVFLDALRSTVPLGLAGMMCSTIFALAHADGMIATVSYFLCGMVLNSLRDRTASLLPGFIAHVAINSLIMGIAQLAQ